MSERMQQREDGTWVPAESLPPQGSTARLEMWLRKRGRNRLANLLARRDERG